jgi:branched-chain amino acid transport system ATP-binding protein
MSVLENLEIGAFGTTARRVRHDTLNRLYEIFPVLRIRANQRAGSLSGGEQQMVSVGRALMSKPKLLLIDEMSLGLAPVIVQEISRVIRELNRVHKMTIFLVEQNVREALVLADRGYVMENGRITTHASTEVLLSSDSVRDAYLGFEPSEHKR